MYTNLYMPTSTGKINILNKINERKKYTPGSELFRHLKMRFSEKPL